MHEHNEMVHKTYLTNIICSKQANKASFMTSRDLENKLSIYYTKNALFYIKIKICFLVSRSCLDDREYPKEHNKTCFTIFEVQMHLL